jgi:hypothetical protein
LNVFVLFVQKIIDYLKIDVEGAEWGVLESLYKSDILQSRVKQLGLEIHTTLQNNSTYEMFQRWSTLKQLENVGFKRWYWHLNHYGWYIFNGQLRSCCYELVYINVRFLDQSN